MLFLLGLIVGASAINWDVTWTESTYTYPVNGTAFSARTTYVPASFNATTCAFCEVISSGDLEGKLTCETVVSFVPATFYCGDTTVIFGDSEEGSEKYNVLIVGLSITAGAALALGLYMYMKRGKMNIENILKGGGGGVAADLEVGDPIKCD